MSKTIGVLAHGGLYTTEFTNEDRYYFGNNYMKRLTECGGVPLGLLPADAKLDERAFAYCDALLICGGTKLWPYHLQAVQHAEKTGKNLLGICLGMQTTNRYFKTVEYIEEHGLDTDPVDLWKADIPTMNNVEGHYKRLVRDHEADSKHRVNLVEGSHIAQLVGSDHLYGATVHHHAVIAPSKYITVTGYAEDGTIEVIERGDNILGTQFHPEADEQLLPLFRWLCE